MAVYFVISSRMISNNENHAKSKNCRVRGSMIRDPESMPSVKTRSSTRIFVPKNISKVSHDGSAARILRNGKRLADLYWREEKDGSLEEKHLETKMEADYEATENESSSSFSSSALEKSFGIFYGRKRVRSNGRKDQSISLSAESSGSRYGIVFIRKHRRKRIKLLTSSSNLWVSEFPWIGPESRIILVILRHPVVDGASFQGMNRLIITLLTGIRKKSVSLFDCAAFLSSGAMARAFSSQGILFLSVRGWENDFSLRRAFGNQGACLLFGASAYVPLISLGFSILPLFFISLHFSLFFSSLRLSSTLETSLLEVSVEERRLMFLNAVEEEHRNREVIFFRGLRIQGPSATETGSLRRSFRPKKRQRRSNSSRRYRRRSYAFRHNDIFGMETVSAVSFPDENIRDLPVQRRKRKPFYQSSELYRFPTDDQTSVGLLCCTANVLVIDSDRCWREKDARITLERSSSNQWCLSIQSEGATRYIHKTQEVKLSSTNRYTQALIWAGEIGWKLEFCNRKDWRLFKELHKECFERNSQVIPVKIIPIPVVREVPGYEDSVSSSFNRPESYIRTADEVERAMKREKPCYDMDSEDEDWIEKVNTRPLSNDSEIVEELLSVETFESMFSAFEKAAYLNPDSCSDQEKAPENFPNFGRTDVVVVFEYWLKKRKRRRSPLVRAFQVRPQKATEQTQNSSLRKKRSFKRFGSQIGGGNSFVYMEGVDEEYNIKRAQVAEARARKAVDYAVKSRTRAQMFMVKAEWSTLKSIMAVRIAGAAGSAESLADDTLSSISG